MTSHSSPTGAPDVEFTVLMPCLDEARTLGVCIDKALQFFSSAGIAGEVLVADNGSSDGSREIAVRHGARVVAVERRGYGAALIGGIAAARGRFVIMGDADDSYDFARLHAFVDPLRAGHELVVGNRFRGGIAPGAMPLLHRYLGNPVLSFLGRLFFGGPLRDFHCGLRGFSREAMLRLDLRASGMEFASEMIVKSLQARLRVTEVPTTLSKDGRDRPPHLRTWRDGWRHLRFLLLFTPRWLFLYPGALLALAGLLPLLIASWAPLEPTGWHAGIHTQLFAAATMVLGYQTVLFALAAILARHFARLDAPSVGDRWARRLAGSPLLPLGGAIVAAAGTYLCIALTLRWQASGYGALDPEVEMRRIIPGVAMVLVGTQSLLASIFFGALRAAFESVGRSVGATRRSTDPATR